MEPKAKENKGAIATEKELEILEDDQLDNDLDPEDPENPEGEDPEDPENPEGEDPEDPENPEGEDPEDPEAIKPKDKTQKRIDQLTAVKKSLEEQLTESKEALDDAREKSKFLEDELAKAKQSYGQGVQQWVYHGKHMYELTPKEYTEVVDMLLAGAEAAKYDDIRKEWLAQLKECHSLRNSSKDIHEKQAEIERLDQELWEAEWGIVSKALLEEAPELKTHAEKLNKLIVPIFINRKKDNDSKFTYRKLADGGVDAKFKHVLALMKREGIYGAAEKADFKNNPNPGRTTGKGSQGTSSTDNKTFTRSQIAKMSMADFERNEKAINRALAKGQIKD